jgi:hypothetical protein
MALYRKLSAAITVPTNRPINYLATCAVIFRFSAPEATAAMTFHRFSHSLFGPCSRDFRVSAITALFIYFTTFAACLMNIWFDSPYYVSPDEFSGEGLIEAALPTPKKFSTCYFARPLPASTGAGRVGTTPVHTHIY